MAEPEQLNNAFPDVPGDDEKLSSLVSATRGLEAFGRKVTTTASHLMGSASASGHAAAHAHYQNAMTDVSTQLRRPNLQRDLLFMARTTPMDLVRSTLSTTGMQSLALSHVPDELLRDLPADGHHGYSLFQAFQASFPDQGHEGKKHRRRISRGRKLIDEGRLATHAPHAVAKLKKDKAAMMHESEMLRVRKHMTTSEINDIDKKMANLADMRRILLDRLAGLEQDEAVLEHDLVEVEVRLEEAQELVEEAEDMAMHTPAPSDPESHHETDEDGAGFMSQSIYAKLPSASSTPARSAPAGRRHRSHSMGKPEWEPGSRITQMRAHQDTVTALDFNAPFGTLVTAAMDDAVRVWDLSAGRCLGHLEGHTASVRALQVEDTIVATGSRDATIRLWDLGKAQHYDTSRHGGDDDDGAAGTHDVAVVDPPAGSMADCPLFTLSAHVDEITALHFRRDVLVSGSADKTLRQWDLHKGRCVQTLDVMWAAAQASALSTDEGAWRQTTRQADVTADFVGALQVFESALACGTADGMVRLWDLRSGQVHRSLVGHTGPVTCLQFDDIHLVTGSLDRSVRIWDLRTGSLYDAYAYDHPITSLMFDTRRIVSAAGEDMVKVYDKVEGRQWDCGADAGADEAAAAATREWATVERVRLREGYLVEGRRDGTVGVWSC